MGNRSYDNSLSIVSTSLLLENGLALCFREMTNPFRHKLSGACHFVSVLLKRPGRATIPADRCYQVSERMSTGGESGPTSKLYWVCDLKLRDSVWFANLPQLVKLTLDQCRFSTGQSRP
jgi:hypothetical protein